MIDVLTHPVWPWAYLAFALFVLYRGLRSGESALGQIACYLFCVFLVWRWATMPTDEPRIPIEAAAALGIIMDFGAILYAVKLFYDSLITWLLRLTFFTIGMLTTHIAFLLSVLGDADSKLIYMVALNVLFLAQGMCIIIPSKKYERINYRHHDRRRPLLSRIWNSRLH